MMKKGQCYHNSHHKKINHKNKNKDVFFFLSHVFVALSTHCKLKNRDIVIVKEIRCKPHHWHYINFYKRKDYSDGCGKKETFGENGIQSTIDKPVPSSSLAAAAKT